MSTLQIEKDAAVKAHGEAGKNGKKLLENLFGKGVFVKNIRERIQTMQDVFELNNTTEEEFNKKWNGFASHEIGNALEVLIAAAYNNKGGELPNFEDGTWKYWPRFIMGSPSGSGFACSDCAIWNASSDVGARLVFYGPEAKENMLDAVKKFLPQYKQSRTT